MKGLTMKILNLDWSDIGLHAAGAFGMFTALNLITDAVLAGTGTVAFWLGREVWQAYKIETSLNPLEWPMQKHAEWVIAVVVVAAMWWQG